MWSAIILPYYYAHLAPVPVTVIKRGSDKL